MGKTGFSSLGKKIRSVEKELTKEIVKWKLKREGQTFPDEEVLDKGSEQIVDQAHGIIKKRGRNLFKAIKQARKEFFNAYHNKDEKKD